MSIATPLLDAFKRGAVDRDVRLLAAAGALAPRANEQLALLIFLMEDADPEVRMKAEATVAQIPHDALSAFLARSDVSISVREFFGDRGIFPADSPAGSADNPLVDTEPMPESILGLTEDSGNDPLKDTAARQLMRMGFTDRLKAALKGSREVRSLLIRDPNKTIAAAVLSSPKVTESEVETFARMATVNEDVLRTIANHRAWMKNYGIVLGLAKNPKTPLALSLNLLARLNERDVNALSTDRNVPEPLRTAARRKVVFGAGR